MGEVIFELRNISKYFPGVVALDDMSLQIKAGEVHGLIGENGAGKSTLIKVLTGVNIPEKGEILVNGQVTSFKDPHAAMQAGVGCVYQELNIIPDMNIIDNLFVGSYVKQNKSFLLDYKKMEKTTNDIMSSLGIERDPYTLCSKLGMGEQQTIEIGKSILRNSRLIIMDEPTSSLSEKEVSDLVKTIERLKSQNIAIIFVSHKLEEIFEICDVVTVMRDGKHISTTDVKNMTKDMLITDMVGRSLTNLYPKTQHEKTEEFLRVENLGRLGVFKDISFSAYGGELLAFSGLVGAGRTEVFRTIFGVDHYESGTVFVKGKAVDIKSPADAISHGMAFLTEDRKKEGLILEDSVLNNVTLTTIDKDKNGLLLDHKLRREKTESYVNQLKIKVSSIDYPVVTLSGGNQQKVVIGKWINIGAEIYIFDEPTRGIDVGAKIEVYNVMNTLTKEGKCVIMISSDLQEVLGMADRVIVMRGGKITGEINAVSDDFDEESIMRAAWGMVKL